MNEFSLNMKFSMLESLSRRSTTTGLLISVLSLKRRKKKIGCSRMSLPPSALNQKSSRVYSVARVYADACSKRPQEYWDYEQGVTIDWGKISNYEIVNKIGRGKYSEVFRGKSIVNDQACVIKVLKPVKMKKIYRELKILTNLSGGPNVIGLLDIVQDPGSKIPALIFEEVRNVDFRTLYPTFTPVSYTHLDVYKRQSNNTLFNLFVLILSVQNFTYSASEHVFNFVFQSQLPTYQSAAITLV